jgi:hypothetical protein
VAEVRKKRMLCGFPFTQVKCGRCRELIWVPDAPGYKDFTVFCNQCMEPKLGYSTGGGRRIVRSGKPQS